MHNPWKAVALGVLALGAIVGTSTLTTAYLLRPPVGHPEMTPPAPSPSLEPRGAVVRVAPASPPRVASPAAADCGTGGDRGALIGGIAGAAIGAGYGAYKAKEECGTVFGEASVTTERAR